MVADERRGELVYQSEHVTIRFEMNRRGIAEMALGPELRAACTDLAARKALPHAISISPVSDRHHQHYVQSFVVESGHTTIHGGGGDWGMRRVMAKLQNLAPHAAAVEWGNAATNGDGHHVLQHTLEYLQASAGRA